AMSDLSLVTSVHATAVEVCHVVYGDTPASLSTIERFYEPDAGTHSSHEHASPSNHVLQYKNPLLTATSRSVITDIYTLSSKLRSVNMPRPIAALCTMLRLAPPGTHSESELFQIMCGWTDIGDVCDSESFDGHRKTIIEHTLHIVFLPGIHDTVHPPFHHPNPSAQTRSEPGLRLPGTSLTLPSPLHIRLPVTTRLSFNEQGRITYHRDLWDLRDVISLVPGASLAQWATTRLTARALSYFTRLINSSGRQEGASIDLERVIEPPLFFIDKN
ncbi:hypothetical protein FISHEDRAFT_47240, partial [Fistulina hepatica ATCC 64428]